MDIRDAQKPSKGTPDSMVLTPVRDTDNVTSAFNEDGTLNVIPDELVTDAVMSESWRYVKDNGITKEDLANLLDSLLTTGNVAWDFMLLNKIPVTFKVRESWVDDVIIERIDSLTANNDKVSAMRYNNLIAEMNLAASLIRFGDQKFDPSNLNGFNENLKFVQKLVFIYKNRLINKLAVFDRAVSIATSDWALRNFTPPLSDN